MRLNLEQRDAVSLEASTVLRAGAGAGKTRVLVARWLLACEAHGHRPDRILAITFTEKAAAEMLERIRKELMDRALAEGGGWEQARHGLWRAPVQTIHSFAGALLREFPLRAGVDPDFGVLEGADRDVLCDEVAAETVDLLADKGDVDLGLLAGAWPRRYLQGRVAELLGNWARFEPWTLRAGAEDPAVAVARWRAAAQTHRDAAVAALPVGARVAAGDPADWPGLLARLLTKAGKPRARLEPEDQAIAEALAPVRAALALEVSYADRDAAALLSALARVARAARARYEAECERERLLDFDRLQSLALTLLDTHESVRRGLRERYDEVLVDEAQDTSPVQWGIIRRLVSDDAGKWPSRGFFAVGDAKQSIYGFRGAEPGRLAGVGREVRAAGGRVRRLATSYRMLEAPLRFCNEVVGSVFDDADPLVRGREPERAGDDGAVELLLVPSEASAATAEALAELVARRLTAVIAARGAASEDAAILLRSRTHLAAWEDALWRNGLPFVVAGGVGFFERREVLDLAGLLAFLHDDRDDVALAGLLRSPLCGLSDVALFGLKGFRGGSLWGALSKRRDALSGPDAARAEAVHDLLRRWRRLAGRIPAGELVRTACEDAGYFGVLAPLPRGDQAIANVEKLIAMLRSDSGPLGPVTRRLDRLISEGAREAQAAVPLDDMEGVRVMTVHAAKGLEFPIVAVADLGAGARSETTDPLLVGRFGGADGSPLEVAPSLRGADGKPTRLIARELLSEAGRAARASEEGRLLYVACTRARDVLILASQLGKAPASGRVDRPLELLRASLGLGRTDEQVAATLLRDAVDSALLPSGLAVPIITDVPGAAAHVDAPEGVVASLAAPAWAAAGLLPESAAAEEPAPALQARLEAPTAAEIAGTAVHAAFEHLEALDEAAALALGERLGREASLDADGLQEVRRRLQQALPHLRSDPQLAAWLATPGARREAEVLHPGPDGSVVRGRMDLWVPGAEHAVVDLKTGEPTPGERVQLAGYREALEAAGHGPARGFIYRTVKGEVEEPGA